LRSLCAEWSEVERAEGEQRSRGGCRHLIHPRRTQRVERHAQVGAEGVGHRAVGVERERVRIDRGRHDERLHVIALRTVARASRARRRQEHELIGAAARGERCAGTGIHALDDGQGAAVRGRQRLVVTTAASGQDVDGHQNGSQRTAGSEVVEDMSTHGRVRGHDGSLESWPVARERRLARM
jgi:hypothetical protein